MFDSSRKVITIGFGSMLLFLILITFVGITSTTHLNNKINELVHSRNVKITLISDLHNIARERSLSLYRMVLKQDPFDVDEEQVNMSFLASQFLKNREQLLRLDMSANEEKMLNDTLEQAYNSTRVQRELLNIIKNNSFEEAKEFLMHQAIPEQNRLLSQYNELLKLQKHKSTTDALNADKRNKQAQFFLLLFSLSIIAIGVLISIYVIRRTTQAEQQLREANASLETRVLERTESLYSANLELEATVETLQDTQEQLVQAEKMASLGSLVAGISHEINTPIGIGLTAITHLQEQEDEFLEHYRNDTMTREHLEDYMSQSQEVSSIVIKNIKRAAELIQNFKQIAVDQSTEEFTIIDLHDYVDDILLSLHPKIKKTQIEISNHCTHHLSLNTNPGAIYQIISNLILNSLIHAYDDNEPGKIDIQAQNDKNLIKLIYSDDGKGIPEKHLKKIFDPFFTTRRGSGGSGLGLHIIYNLVNNTLKGSIRAESHPGKGSQFILTLPLLNEP